MARRFQAMNSSRGRAPWPVVQIRGAGPSAGTAHALHVIALDSCAQCLPSLGSCEKATRQGRRDGCGRSTVSKTRIGHKRLSAMSSSKKSSCSVAAHVGGMDANRLAHSMYLGNSNSLRSPAYGLSILPYGLSPERHDLPRNAGRQSTPIAQKLQP